MKPRTYIKEQASSLAATTAPRVPVKLSDYSRVADNTGAIKRVKSRGRSKARDTAESSTNKGSTGCQKEFTKYIAKSSPLDTITDKVPDSVEYIWDAELAIPNKILTSSCPCPSETKLFNVWGTHNIYLILHNSNCKDDPNHSKELFNNKVRQVYELLINNNPSRVHSAIKRGSMKLHIMESGTVRRRLPDKDEEAFCDQHQWVSIQDLHRIIFAPDKSRPIADESNVKSGYLSTGGLLLLLEGYTNTQQT